MNRHVLCVYIILNILIAYVSTTGGGQNVLKNSNRKEKARKPSKGKSLPQSPIIDLMMQSVAPNFAPKDPGDLFDILRDKYPLPNGEFTLTLLTYP